MIRDEVRTLISLGPLPDSSADANLEEYEKALDRISRPVSNDEARALLSSFGSDDCFGLAWTLLHLIETIETAPNPPPDSAPVPGANEWIQLLWESKLRAR